MSVKGYEIAKEMYAKLGVDTEKALQTVDNFEISMQCWQADDVTGFENTNESLSGGIAATGNFRGKARNPKEVRDDLQKAMSLVPGTQKINLHAFYLEADKKVDRDEITEKNFENWAYWAKELKIGLDFNPTIFSHANSADGFTLSHKDKKIRDFWIEHCKRSRKIAEFLGKTTGKTCVTNVWIPDGMKDNPADRFSPRERLKESLDEIFKENLSSAMKDAVESKLFGIGSESYVVGSHEFYMGYAIKNNKLLTLDTGHFHPTETVSNKISALMLYLDELLLHVSRPVRWDSDHVVSFDEETQMIMQEVVRGGFENRVNIALDFFDASINRVAALIIGTRNTQKALLKALLEPVTELKKAQENGDYTKILALNEELKAMPWSLVYDEYCIRKNVPVGMTFLDEIKKYEDEVLSKR